MKAATRNASTKRLDKHAFQSTPPVKAATSWRNNPIPSRLFQSTPPVKAATALNPYRQHRGRISIHAAREGGDEFGKPPHELCNDFNPRRP